MLSKNYRELLLKKVNLIKKMTLGIIGFCLVFMIIAACTVFYYTYSTFGTINISSCFILFGIIFFTIKGLLMKSFFKSYNEVITSMNDEDLETLENLDESRSWIEKYLPSFIIYSGKIRIFKLYHQPDLAFTDLTKLSIRPNYFTRGRQNKLVIFRKSNGKTIFFSIDSNPIQHQHLIERALTYNPKIIIKDR